MAESKEDFYDFGLLMRKDSEVLFSDNRLHTSVYLAGYVLESYIKILLIVNGSGSRSGVDGYGGHVNSGNFVNRLMTIEPTAFSNSILFTTNDDYPTKLLNGTSNDVCESKWDINGRYEVNRWVDSSFSSCIQTEINNIESKLVNMKLDGVI